MNDKKELSLSTRLANVSNLIAANEGLAERAVQTIEATMKRLCVEDLTKVHVIQGDSVDEGLSDLQNRAQSAITYCKEGRMPITSMFDEIRRTFTAQEKKIEVALNQIKEYRGRWAAEKERRIRIQEEEKARKLAKENEKIRIAGLYEAALRKAINDAYAYIFSEIWEDFCRLTIEDLQEGDPKQFQKSWEAKIRPLEGYAPGPDIAPNSSILDQAELRGVLADVYQRVYPEVAKKAKDLAISDINGLAQQIPARIEELKSLSKQELEARDKAEAERKRLEAEQAAEQARAALEAEQAAARLEATLEVSTAEPSVVQAKGTAKKLKYKPTSHAAFIAIITNWVENHMAKMTVEELTKKLSFMITAANNDLKDGVELKAKGLEIVEDFTVRGRAKK